jgi:predicted acylesterase/phospholipase RssA
MKGGITSGVVYPLAACELAKAFRFKNIGGTSAGAIAAAATAAAELGREVTGGGFQLLKDLPDFLGAKPSGAHNSNLFYLFQPQRGTKPIFDVCVAALGGGWSSVPRVLFTAARAFWPWLLLGLFPGLAFTWRAAYKTSGSFFAACLVFGIFFALGLGILCLAVGFVRRCTRSLPANFFGLCSGMRRPSTSNSQSFTPSPEPLTPWLSSYLNRLAGRPADGPPLTFGDLWGAKDSLAPRNINLEMMTTCLSFGRPYRLPFRNDEFVREDGHFFFRSDELGQLFPKQVVDWMEQHPRTPRSDLSRQGEATHLKAGYRPLPEPWDLPVVVAVRMSLSFPILLSAVPLHAIDYGRKNEADRTLECCWFSDGGISSNFPVHFFDSLLPRWPTFAITLANQHPDYPAGTWLPSTNSPGTERWTRFDHDATAAHKPLPGAAQLFGFLGAIMNAMQNWSDNTQARLPGYRDRIATVSLTKDQGGLNLNMPKPRIDLLAGFGRDAGIEFTKRFANPNPDCPLDWSNHRWVRLRSALAVLEDNLLQLEASCAAQLKPDQPYDVWVRITDNDSLPSYPWVVCGPGLDWTRQRQIASDTLAVLRQCAKALQLIHANPAPLATGAPRPRPELRVRPRI